MAGEEDYFEVTAEINKWFLDYLCLTTWKNFKESKQVTVGDRDLIQGRTPGFLKHEFSMWVTSSGAGQLVQKTTRPKDNSDQTTQPNKIVVTEPYPEILTASLLG